MALTGAPEAGDVRSGGALRRVYGHEAEGGRGKGEKMLMEREAERPPRYSARMWIFAGFPEVGRSKGQEARGKGREREGGKEVWEKVEGEGSNGGGRRPGKKALRTSIQAMGPWRYMYRVGWL